MAVKLFEVSWEVCNKVGGIYTVISTKAKYIKEIFGDNYYLIGPYLPYTGEFLEKEKPEWIREIEKELESRGIKIHFGTWLIDGEPNVILIDFKEFFENEKNYWKTKFWEWYKIDSLNSPYDYDEPFIWSVAAGIFLEKVDNIFLNDTKIIHAHEWLSGGTILYLKKVGANYKKIFTIHGTVVGRTLSSTGKTIYKFIDKINPDLEAYNYGVYSKHQLEKSSTQNADIFTTVSDITSKEAKHILGREADTITYNGFKFSEKSFVKFFRRARKKLEEFVNWYFLPYYDIDFENLVYMYTIGRYEYYNKGFDIIINSLGLLNRKLKDKTILFFFFVPSGTVTLDPRVQKNAEIYEGLKDLFNEYKDDIFNKFLRYVKTSELKFNEDFLTKFENYYASMYHTGKPPVVTHILSYSDDIIVKNLLSKNLDNKKENPVKVVFIPVYLGAGDGIFNQKPYELLPGFDLGIFLSRYEPFGYTALEAISYRVPIIVSTYTGFFSALNKITNGKIPEGIFPVDMKNNPEEQVVKYIHEFITKSFDEKMELKLNVVKIAKKFSWDNLIWNYLKLYSKY